MMSEKEPKKDKAHPEVFNINIKRENPDNLQPIYVNDFTVSHTKDTFFLTFSQVEPPPVQNPDELRKIQSIIAPAKSKLVMTENFIREVSDVLVENIRKYDEANPSK